MDQALKDNPQLKQGYLYAVRLLTASKKSTKEIARRLTEKGYAETNIKHILELLKNQGILNDHKLVGDTVQLAKQAKRYGKRKIYVQLKQKGIDSKIIEDALGEYSKEEEQETALELAQNRWDKLSKIEIKKRKQRVYSYLIGRGFDFDIVRETLEQLNSKS